MTRPALLLIGGIDPTGQAGLARDIAVCADLDVAPCPVPTMLTVQTSSGVDHVEPTSAHLLRKMIDAAWEEHRPVMAKVGAIADVAQAEVILDTARERGIRLLLDPVLATSSGHAFAPPSAWAGLVEAAELVVPNEAEAEALGLGDGGAVHVTRGGDAAGEHRGTGDRFATHVACRLLLGLDRDDAIAAAHRAMHQELAIDAQATPEARQAHMQEARRGLHPILAELHHQHVPEVGINFAYATAGARDPRQDVIGLAGRITIAGFDRAVAGHVAWGGPHHTGRIAVVLQEHPGPGDRPIGAKVAVMNHRFDDAFLQAARRGGLTDVGFRREDEPPDAPSSMEWGVRDCIERNRGRIPDLAWDRGGIGKEAMIRVIGRDPTDLARKLRVMHDVGAVLTDPDRRPAAIRPA